MPRDERLADISMTKQSLTKIKRGALRSKAWYTALSKVERAILDLTIKCVERVRSHTLATTISHIVEKILNVLEGGFMERAEKVGREIAEDLISVAERWGNRTCAMWMQSEAYVKLLGVNALHT